MVQATREVDCRGIGDLGGDSLCGLLLFRERLLCALAARQGVTEVSRMYDRNLPQDVARALADKPSIRHRFLSLAPSHKEEYLRWIEQARRPDTRARRIQQMLEMIERRP